MAIAGKIYRALLRFFEKYYGFFLRQACWCWLSTASAVWM